jgi:16S rRNA (guanine527-N7)-methyltransferase
MLHDLLKDGAAELGISISPDDISRFILYMDELLFWNKKVNLTSITDKTDVVVKHFLDSLTIFKAVKISDQSMIDVGAGAGFPGIPIKIVAPKVRMVLLDSVKKKVDFLGHIISLLDMTGAEAKWGRAEEFGRSHRAQFDIAISRALAPLNVLLEYLLPLVKVGGSAVCMKSEKIDEEVSSAKNALNELGGEIADVVQVVLPTTDIMRKIVIVKKSKDTPMKYPRTPGEPKKNPL